MASAHFQLCRALLEAGHAIDLYADPTFIPDPNFESEQFHYVPVHVDLRRELDLGRLPAQIRVLADRRRGARRTFEYRDRAMTVALSRHMSRKYDAVLFLGLAPGSTIGGIPTVVWPQSGPQNELLAVRGMRKPITRVSGLMSYVQLRLYYEVKDRRGWEWSRHHHLILCSQASRTEAIAFGAFPDRVCVAPYPINLDKFAPGRIPTGAPRQVLCIGRLDPRKRVDLLVDAVALLTRRRQDFRVEVIGRDGYMSGWRAFVETAGRGLPITYTEAVDQSEVIRRLRSADLVVQPSEREEFGHAVAEALACGIPTLTGPTNGTGEYSPRDGIYQFERYSPESLADGIDRALAVSRDPAVRTACRAAADAFAPARVAATVAEFIFATKA